jgi:hypothetical protein
MGLRKFFRKIEHQVRPVGKAVLKVGLPVAAAAAAFPSLVQPLTAFASGALGSLGKSASHDGSTPEAAGETRSQSRHNHPGRPFTPAEEEAIEEELENNPHAAFESPLDIFRRLFPKRVHQNRLEGFMPHVEPMKQYARGGSIGHVKKSGSSGVADDIDTAIPEGSYVWNTTDTSLLGDGSPENGVRKIRTLESHLERSGIVRSHEHEGKLMPVKLSNDEYVMEPKYVAALGKLETGDPRKGPKVIDKARMNLRKQKGVKKILPPKSKDLQHYFKGGSSNGR